MGKGRNKFRALVAASLAVGLGACVFAAEQAEQRYKVHDMSRPRPEVITPGSLATQEKPSTPPSDAIVLLGGKEEDLAQNFTGGPWKFEDGVYVGNKSSIVTKQEFGDCQLHVEWAEPTPATGSSQGRGNSGIIFFGHYEVQVLDCYKNDTYPDGQTAAIYGQYPPLVNCCRPPGEWQTYDIVFRAPHFDDKHNVTRKGRFTVFQNGVLVQDSVELMGDTFHGRLPKFTYFEPKGHLEIQFHGNPVRYRQIWLRPLGEEVPPAHPLGEK